MDESGDHDLRHVDPNWPVFLLVGLLVGEKYYQRTVVPRVKALKKAHGFPTDTILHSREIRRWTGAFSVLADETIRKSFYADLNDLVESLRIRVYAVAIHKQRLLGRFIFPVSPYDISLSQLLSVICGTPGMPAINRPVVARIIAESRGTKEDKELQAEFQNFKRLGLSSYGSREVSARRPLTVRKTFPRRVDFVRKARAVSGLELADLIAYPIARAIVNQSWENPAYVLLAKKLRGLVIFP